MTTVRSVPEPQVQEPVLGFDYLTSGKIEEDRYRQMALETYFGRPVKDARCVEGPPGQFRLVAQE